MKPSEKITQTSINFFLLPSYFLLRLLKLFFRIKFWRIRDNRIGHLAGNTDFLLREFQLDDCRERKYRHIFISSKKPANYQLLRMLKRNIRIIPVPQPKPVKAFIQKAAANSILSKSKLFQELPDKGNFQRFIGTKSSLSFTTKEEQKGKELLKRMEIKSWFVCFHSRDSTYLNNKWDEGDISHSYRNCDIHNFIKSIKYINQQGGYGIRMGSEVSQPLKSKDYLIIDYAINHHSDFGDIYLPSKCKFFIGNTSGLFCISLISNVPVAFTNLLPLNTPFLSERDIFIPKKIWSEKEKRYLTFNEMINSEVVNYVNSYDYIKAGLTPLENSAEEILGLVIEINERLDGRWKESKEDCILQERFKSLFSKDSSCYGLTARMGANFLRENKHLLL